LLSPGDPLAPFGTLALAIALWLAFSPWLAPVLRVLRDEPRA
jgi:hypothetical protein